MDQVEAALRIFAYEAEPVDDERPREDWREFDSECSLDLRNLFSGAFAGQRHVPAKLIHHEWIPPLRDISRLRCIKMGALITGDVGIIRHGAEAVELAHDLCCEQVKRVCVAVRCEGQKAPHLGESHRLKRDWRVAGAKCGECLL